LSASDDGKRLNERSITAKKSEENSDPRAPRAVRRLADSCRRVQRDFVVGCRRAGRPAGVGLKVKTDKTPMEDAKILSTYPFFVRLIIIFDDSLRLWQC
jgi:hypothetical protein